MELVEELPAIPSELFCEYRTGTSSKNATAILGRVTLIEHSHARQNPGTS